MTETRVTDSVYDGEIHIPAYTCIRSDSMSRQSGGVVFYALQPQCVKMVKSFQIGYNNLLICDISNCDNRGRYFLTYHSPSASHAEFLDFLDEILENFMHVALPVYLLGDFNINVMNKDNIYCRRLIALTRAYGLKQIVYETTRAERNSRSIIDLVFTNNVRTVAKPLDTDWIADHKTIEISKQSSTAVRNHNKFTIFDRTSYNAIDMRAEMNQNINRNLMETMNNDEKSIYFENVMIDSVNKFVIKKEIDNKYSKEWYNEALRNLRLERNRAGLIAESLDTEEAWLEYRRVRNRYNRKCNQNKNNSIKNKILRVSDDPKKLWKELKRLIGSKNVVRSSIICNDVTYTDHKEIANIFNRYFIQSIKDIKSSIPRLPYKDYIDESRIISPGIEFNELNYVKLMSIITHVKKKTGINNVNKQVLADVADYANGEGFGNDILNIFNESLRNGICPAVAKKTIVTPIPKVKNSLKIEDNRPINSISIMDKTLELYVKEHLDLYVGINNLISDCQSGFRSLHSCETAINFVIAKWKQEIDEGKIIVVVFFDLKRAFETVDRTILLKKLERYGIDGNVLKWITSWLTNRKQKTRFGNEISDEIPIDEGIPQGTPLSCLLFCLYVNDLPECVLECNTKMFCDDTVTWVAEKSLETAMDKITRDNERIDRYMKENKLKLNYSKTKFMILGSDELRRMEIDQNNIEMVSTIKYLGVIIDKKLRFKDNLDYALKKMAKKAGFISRIKKKLDTKTKLLLYKSLAAPHLDYCASILFLNSDTDIKKLQKQQNKILRSILCENRYASVENMLNNLSLLDVKQRICYNVLVLFYKIEKGLVPKYLQSNLRSVSESQPYPLRSNESYRLPNYVNARSQNSLMYKGLNMFNQLKMSVNVNENLDKVKENIAAYVKSNFSSH